MDGSERYYAKRAAGISPVRKDGSICHPGNDSEAFAAEEWACALFSLATNTDIYARRGDGGTDMPYRGWTINVKWLGCWAATLEPRQTGSLIVNPDDKHADIYLLISGNRKVGFTPRGWQFHTEVIKRTKDFGFGPKWHCPVDELRDLQSLFDIAEKTEEDAWFHAR